MTKRDAERIMVVVDRLGGFNRVEEFMQVLAQDACSQVEKDK